MSSFGLSHCEAGVAIGEAGRQSVGGGPSGRNGCRVGPYVNGLRGGGVKPVAAVSAYSFHQWKVNFGSAGLEYEPQPSASPTRAQVRSEAAFPSWSIFWDSRMPSGSGAKDSASSCRNGGQIAYVFVPQSLMCL